MSRWAEKYRILSGGAESARWSNEKTPYLVEIMDATCLPLVREVALMASSQVGKTEILINCELYNVDVIPCNQLHVAPTEQFAKDFSRERLSPAIEKCEKVRGKISDAKSRDGGNRLAGKQYPGGFLVLVGANSPTGLASRPVRRVYLDEIDRFPDSAGSEGDPIKLAETRMITFPDAKSFKVSSPTIDGKSKIQKAYERSDKRVWEVPCPICDTFQVLEFERIFKEDKRPAVYQCAHCSQLIEHREKTKMLARGRWRAQAPFEGIAGFWIGGENSPWLSWDALVTEYHKVKNDEQELKTFYNTKLGRPYKPEYLVVDLSGVTHDGEEYAYECPPEVLAITAGVDVQGNRLECCVIGWGIGDEAWVLDYRIIEGDPEGNEVWEKLKGVLSKEYRSRDWSVRIEKVAVDCSYLSRKIYETCKANRGWGWFAARGTNQLRAPLLSRKMLIGPHKEWEYYRVGTNFAKHELYKSLALTDQGPRFIHFPARDEDRYRLFDDEFFRQLYAEKLVIVTQRGEEIVTYEKKRPGIRNEVLDTFVLNLAALKLLSPNYQALHDERHAPSEPDPTPRPRRSFVKNW